MFSRVRRRFFAPIFVILIAVLFTGPVSSAWAEGDSTPQPDVASTAAPVPTADNSGAASASVSDDSSDQSGDSPDSPQPADAPTDVDEPDSPDAVVDYDGESSPPFQIADPTAPSPESSDVQADPIAPPPKADAPSASTESDASEIAQANGHNVVVDEATTETTEVEALPDGTFQLTSSSIPVRVERDNSWVDVDTNLGSAVDGFIAPAATVVPVRFSAGGSGPIAQVQLPSGDWFNENWELGSLPAPSVDGATATYADVIPDVDLRLNATATGMTEVVVVKTPEAAEDPRLATLKLKVTGAALATTDDGGTVVAPTETDAIERPRTGEPFVDAVDVDTMLRSNEPHAWDSTLPDAGPGGPGGNGVAQPIDSMITGGNTVAVDVDSVTSDPDVKYPVYVDPDWTSFNIHAWSINRTYPDTSYLDLPEDSDGRGNQVVGYLHSGWTAPHSGDGREQLGISFWQMSTANVAHKQIIRADFDVTESWSASCDPRGVQLYRTTNPGAGATWNQSGSVQYIGVNNSSADWPNHPLDTQNVAYADYCGGNGEVDFNATTGVAQIAQAGQPEIALALRAEHEDDTYSWKRFNLAAKLIIKYNTVPNAPTNPGFSAPQRGCSTSSASPTYINPNAPLTMFATFTDPDPENIYAKFQIVKANDGNANVIPPIVVGPIAQGVVQNPTPVTLGITGSFAMGVSTQDAAGADSGRTYHCFFNTDGTPPGLPTVVPPSTGVVGEAMNVTVTTVPADHVVRLEYWWTLSASTASTDIPVIAYAGPLPACGGGAGKVMFACPDSDNHFTIKTAPIDQLSTLHVASIDAAGNTSVSAGTIASSNVNVSATPSSNVSYSKGHGWLGRSFTNATVPVSIPDANTNSPTDTSATGTTKDLPLKAGAGYDGTATSQGLQSGEFDPVTAVNFPGYAALDRIVGSQHMAVLEGTMPAGFHVESLLGHIIADVPGATHTNMHKIYSCTQTNGDEFTTKLGPCEGVAGTSVTLGWIWNDSQSAPAQQTPIYRCVITSSGDHFDSPYSNCEGQHVDYLLGYAAKIEAIQTNDLNNGGAHNGPAVDTTKSFTVSAWVKPNTPLSGMYHTIASQGGSTSAGFYLQSTPAGEYRFCVRSQVTLVADCATSQPGLASNGDWRYVTGVWDAVDHQIRLHLNGDINAVAFYWHSTPTNEISASGNLSIGSSITNGCRTNMWDGQIADVTIFPGVVNTNQLTNLINHDAP